MGKKPNTVWPIRPHTTAKHDILRRYLQAWFPIMDRWNQRILYIDGFAGPGEYRDGETGSPVIALETAVEHRRKIRNQLVCFFVEARQDRHEHLKGILDAFRLPANIRVHCLCGRFDEFMTELLDYLDEQNKRMAPTFALIDPFGYSHTPFSTLQRIMGHDKCEVLITFMYEEVNRFVCHPDAKQHAYFDELFGTTAWRQVRGIRDSEERRQFVHDLYKTTLKTQAAIKYVRSFEMLNRGNRTDYFLFFGTNSYTGLKKMKEAMWKVDPSAGVGFSDATDLGTPVLFQPEPNYSALERAIRGWASHRTVDVEEVERFVVADTPFRETHFKRQILKRLEEHGELTVVESHRKRRHVYPQGTRLRFGPEG